MDLWYDDVTIMASVYFIFRYFIGFAIFAEFAGNSFDELKTGDLRSLAEDLPQEFTVQPGDELVVSIVINGGFTEVNALSTIAFKFQVGLGE